MADVASVSDVQKEALRQLMLDAKVVSIDRWNRQIRIDSADSSQWRRSRHSATRGIRQIAALVLHLVRVGRYQCLGEDHVPLGPVMVCAESAADGRLIASKW